MNGNTSTHIVNLADFAARLAELRSVEPAGELLCAAAQDVLGADGASALLSDGRGCYFTRYAVHLAGRAPSGTGRSPGALELSASGLALCKNCPVIVPEVAHDRRTPAALYGPLRVESLVAVPVHGAELAAPLGALECHFRKRHSVSVEEIQRLQLLAGVAALGLRLIHLRTRMSVHKRGRATDLEALSRHFLRAAPARQKAEAEARRLALTDELTGLYNRRGLFARGAALLKDGRSRGRPVYILYADVDGLKAVNDSQGHEAGIDSSRPPRAS